MKKKLALAVAPMLLAIASQSSAETYRVVCLPQVSGQGLQRLTLVRDDQQACQNASGNPGDADIITCASIQIETSDGQWDSSASFNVTCYARNGDETQTLSCTGFNGPFATLALMVNGDSSFTSAYIYGNPNQGQNAVLVSHGQCEDGNSY